MGREGRDISWNGENLGSLIGVDMESGRLSPSLRPLFEVHVEYRISILWP